jgi:hypothetical protein
MSRFVDDDVVIVVGVFHDFIRIIDNVKYSKSVVPNLVQLAQLKEEKRRLAYP